MDVQLPDGTIVRGVPDGMSKADLTAKLASNGYDISKLSATRTPVSTIGAASIPGASPEADAALAQERAKLREQGPDKPVSTMDKLTGAAEALGSLVTGATSGAVGYVGGALGGIAGSIANGDFGTDQGLRRAKEEAEASAARLTYQPKTKAGQEYLGKAAEAIDSSGVAGLPIGPELNTIATLAKPAGSQLRAAAARGVDQYADQALGATGQLRQRIDAKRAMAGGGAAVSEHANMAAATGATPNVIKAIEDAGADVHPVAAQRHAEASSLPVPAELSAGQASGNAELISREKNLRGKYPELGDLFNRQDENIIQNLDEVRQKVAPDVSAQGVDLGQLAVDAYKNMDEPVVADISAKYKALEAANGGNFPLSGTDFVSSADAALKKKNRARFLPAEVRGIMDDLRDGGSMTFNDFENYRTILAEQSRKAERAGDGTAKAAINIVRNSLESLPMTNETAAIKPLADAARNAARNRFDRIKMDPAYDAAINDGAVVGQPSPIADKFIGNYVVKGSRANVDNMLQNLSNDPLNKQIISAGVIDHLKSASGIDLRTNTGNITQKGMNSALTMLDKKAPLILGDDANQIVNRISNVAKWQMEQKKATYVNNSNTATSAFAEGAKDLANGALDVKTLGATKFIRNMMDKRAQQRLVNDSIKPGAGININEYPALRSEIERNNGLPPAYERPEPIEVAPPELGLAPDGPLAAPAVAPYQESPSVGLMSLADDAPVAPSADAGLSARTDYPSVDFPLRQEILQRPEVAASVDAYRAESARLMQIRDNAISEKVRAKAGAQLEVLQANFAQSMGELGISSAADATGINRPLYETRAGTRLPIQSTFSPLADRLAQQRAANQQRLQAIGQATTIDEAIQAAGQRP